MSVRQNYDPDDVIAAQKEILFREGFLQATDWNNLERVRSRWALRSKVPQISAKALKERGD